MLPDYPVIKEKLYKSFLNRMRLVQQEYSHPLSEASKVRRFEGNKSTIINENGRRRRIKTMKYSSKFSINLEEIHDMSPIELIKRLDEVAIVLAKQQSLSMFDQISKSAERVGNVVQAKGKPTVNTFFKVLEKIQLDFNERTGEAYFPTIVAGEKGFQAFKKVFPQLEANERNKKRFEKIINKKREEWRARESNRELVG